MTFTDRRVLGTIRHPRPRQRVRFPQTVAAAAFPLRDASAAVRTTSNQQGVLRVRLSPFGATFVAGFLSILAWATPLVAQGPTVPRQPTAGPPVNVTPPAPVGTSVV